LARAMNKRWPQQVVFAERVRDYCRRNGLLTPRGAVKMDEAADLFGLHEDTLRQLLQDTTRKRPYIDTLVGIASVLGCSVTEFLDAPGDPAPGMSAERWAGLSERERVMASSLLAALGSDDLSVAEKEVLFSTFQGLKDALVRLKKGGGSEDL